MQIHIHVISDKFEKFYSDAIDEYKKRLGRYCKIKLFQHKKLDSFNKKVQASYMIRMNHSKDTISSEALADLINHLAITGKSKISIILSELPIDVDCDMTMSISPMDMDMGLQSTILYEQIYRAFRIIRGEPYHK